MKRSFVGLTSIWSVLALAAGAVLVIALAVVLTSPSPNALTSRLLSVSNLPSGWTAASPKTTTLDLPGSGCLAGRTAKSAANETTGSVAFYEGSGLPLLGDSLVSGPTVVSEFAKDVQTLASCRSLTFTQDKKKIHATITPIKLARVGSQSAAYTLDFSVSGLHVVADIVLFATSRYVGEVVYADTASPQPSAVAAYATLAAQKADGKPVIATATSVVSAPVRIARTGMGAIGYRRFGSGPPLVMIMGYGGTMEAWDPRFIDALAQHHEVIIFDNAGIGDTEALPTPLTIDAMAEQTSALIKALGLNRPDILGWSMGGMIAQALAVEYPSQVGRLVLCATFPGTGTIRPSQGAIDSLKSTNSDRVMSVLFPTDQGTAKQDFEIATADYPPSSPAQSKVVIAQTHAVDVWFEGGDGAGRHSSDISAPTLVADGTVDRLDPVANDHQIVSLIPNAQLVLYSDAGHAFLFQDETTFVATVEAFLNSK